MATLAYPFWFVVFPLVYMTPDKRQNPFLRFHVYQGAALGVGGIVGLSVVRATLALLFRWMIIVDMLLYPMLKMAETGVLLLVVYGAFTAFRGTTSKIPYLSEFIKSLGREDTRSKDADSSEV